MLVIISFKSVVSLRFHFGGGGSKFVWKSGCIYMARSAMQRVAKQRLLTRENFFKWCNLVRFREYFANNNILSPDFLSLVRFGVFWSTVSVNFLLRKYYNYLNDIDMVLLRTSYS